MSDTPRTDAVIKQEAWRQPDTWVTQIDTLIDHARQLERELADARKVIEAYQRLNAQPSS